MEKRCSINISPFRLKVRTGWQLLMRRPSRGLEWWLALSRVRRVDEDVNVVLTTWVVSASSWRSCRCWRIGQKDGWRSMRGHVEVRYPVEVARPLVTVRRLWMWRWESWRSVPPPKGRRRRYNNPFTIQKKFGWDSRENSVKSRRKVEICKIRDGNRWSKQLSDTRVIEGTCTGKQNRVREIRD